MADYDPDKLKGPGGLTLRQIHEQVKQSAERDRQARSAEQAGAAAADNRSCATSGTANAHSHKNLPK